MECDFFFFNFGEKGREKEGEKHQYDKEVWIVFRTGPDQGLNPQPRHVPRLEIEPVTFRFVG